MADSYENKSRSPLISHQKPDGMAGAVIGIETGVKERDSRFRNRESGRITRKSLPFFNYSRQAVTLHGHDITRDARTSPA